MYCCSILQNIIKAAVLYLHQSYFHYTYTGIQKSVSVNVSFLNYTLTTPWQIKAQLVDFGSSSPGLSTLRQGHCVVFLGYLDRTFTLLLLCKHKLLSLYFIQYL